MLPDWHRNEETREERPTTEDPGDKPSRYRHLPNEVTLRLSLLHSTLQLLNPPSQTLGKLVTNSKDHFHWQ
jgi:hypothetical protein